MPDTPWSDAGLTAPLSSTEFRALGLTNMLLLPGGEVTPHAAHSSPQSEPSMWAGIPDEFDLHIYHRDGNVNPIHFLRLNLAFWWVDDSRPYPTLPEMAIGARRTERTVKRYLKELTEAGLIELVERQRCTGEREMAYSFAGAVQWCRDELGSCAICVKGLDERREFHARCAAEAKRALQPRHTPSNKGTKAPTGRRRRHPRRR
jgi:hypothetical protein